MTYRQQHSPTQAAANPGLSRASVYRLENAPTLGSRKKAPRGRRRPDPLAGIFDEEVIPILHSAPAIGPVAVFEELLRRHPSLSTGIRRTLQRRILQWKSQSLALARGDGSYAKQMSRLARTSELILDDWGLAPLTAEQRRDFFSRTGMAHDQ